MQWLNVAASVSEQLKESVFFTTIKGERGNRFRWLAHALSYGKKRFFTK
ncbi:MAG: hypothetical protein ACKVJU_08985 [Verrucomicrobiales bacterium]